MILADILETGLIEDDIRVRILILHPDGPLVVASGNWYQDQILDYGEREVRRFTIDNNTRVAHITVEGDLYWV